MTPTLGVVGGMGPLASAAFLSTLYELTVDGAEQSAPACILLSNPAVPDRTESVLGGRGEAVLSPLRTALETLCRLGASKLVIACVSSHYFLSALAGPVRAKMISLIDLIVDGVAAAPGRHVLLCTNLTRRMGLLESHARWGLIAPRVVLPADADQQGIHRMIYESLKRNRLDDRLFRRLDELAARYGTRSFIAGCTELHLLTRHLRGRVEAPAPYHVVDPLVSLARDARRLLRE